MKKMNVISMESLTGGVWCSGSDDVDFWSGMAAGVGAILLFTPAFALGGTILVHSGGALLLNHQCLE